MDKRDPRVERLAGKVPSWYSPFRHFFITIGTLILVIIGLIALLLFQQDPWPSRAWLLAGAFFLVGNLSEYLVHRYPMHKRYKKLKSFFKSHTITHHRFFTQRDMAMSRSQDLFFILPSYSVIVFSLILLSAVFVSSYLVFGVSEAVVSTAALATYGVLSEALHVAFHLPDKYLEYPLLRGDVFKWMRRHHRLHHAPEVMRAWNFNIGIPFCDWMFGTLAPNEMINRADE